MSNIIKTHTNEGDIIFDPFSGSGEISYNAFINNRKYIATEINKNYFNGSISRFNKLYISPAYNHIGNKKRIISDLLNNFSTSKIDYFVDVFAGSGVVSANFNRANKYILNDNDKHVSDILEYLFNTKIETILKEINEVIDFYKLPRNSFSKYNDQYSTLKSDFNYNKKNKFNRVSMLFVLILFGFNQQIRVNSSGNFNIPAGKFFITDYQFNKIKNFVKLVKKVNAKIYNKDFVDLIKDIKKTISLKDCIFYFDPPYLITNGTYNAS
ncbi:MAG: DNA adenine methylase [Bacilli bacterium]